MNKIPATQTIAETYNFTVAGMGRVIGLIWLPVAIMTIGGYFTMVPYLTGMAEISDNGDPSQVGPLLMRVLGFDLVVTVLMAMVAVAITREILQPLKRPPFLRFGLGLTELRVVGGFFGLYVLLIVFTVMLVMACMAVGFVANALIPGNGTPASHAPVVGIVALAGLAGGLALIYFFVRLGFLLVPSAVLEGGFGLERSWQLTKGNFWRIVLIGLATLIPIMLLKAIIDVSIIGPDFFNPHLELLKDHAVQAKHQAEQMRVMAAHLPLLMGAGFLLAPFTYGLTFAAPAFAYRALTAKPASPLQG